MGAQKMGFFTRAEFKGGLAELGATTLAQLRRLLPTLSAELASPHALEEFHKFAFRFCLTVRAAPARAPLAAAQPVAACWAPWSNLRSIASGGCPCRSPARRS
jgi:hypothetical protein